jgi:hypothetical protein
VNKPALSIVVDPNLIDIDRGIPMPAPRRKSPWPFDKMKVGDSFFIDASRKAAVKAAIQARQRATPERYATRTKEHGVRVWRVK